MVNDVTARDFQYRSAQWLQGKTFERSTPGGVGHARRPGRYPAEGMELVTRAEGIGECRNILIKGA